MHTRVLFEGDLFLLDLGDVVQNFEKSDDVFWCNFVFIDFQGEFYAIVRMMAALRLCTFERLDATVTTSSVSGTGACTVMEVLRV